MTNYTKMFNHKIGIFSPYLNTLSGGERYVASIAECFSKKPNQVDLLWQDKEIKNKLSTKLNIDLSSVDIDTKGTDTLRSKHKLIQKWALMRKYNAFFVLSDGSVPFLFSKNNFLLFQNPFPTIRPNITNKIKLSLIRKVICNSNFTKSYIDQEFGVDSIVIYPPVDTKKFKVGHKENIILSVGRFVWNKKQDVLITAFKQLCDDGLKNWELLLAGNTFDDDSEYIQNLKKQSLGYQIRIVPNPNFVSLRSLYGKSKIYWHATGFGEDVESHPEYTEHFGITTVEAMASGNVPVVVNLGGQPEIVKDNISGFLWDNINDLKQKSLLLINNPNLLRTMSTKATKECLFFSKQVFVQSVLKLF
ncbi:MAG: hypothetical protein UT39_C0002G0006 [Candidatus Woesebacteria bacterium GW2011_GWA1_39_21]|uniref:Glycosyl transferase family 1 domain-containing protein n=1 Tax=Candidatus Woesebacteria bacterium GW2011_GWA1_39_21 TaxID=1618550 RepID=A0A0G0QN62_9BACT|nr:MAG: hypothetical protein UT39_C0002G0006 [Candidatus Woesebacteria bacterium GW2011_GWA1_39_21]